MGNIFHLYLVVPFFNILILIYNFLPWPDIGVATIILTFIIRLIFFPIFYKSTKQQIIMNRIQPELQKIQKEYKNDKEKQVKAQMELYKKHKVSPFGSCLLMLAQLPIIFAVYRVFLNGFSSERLADLYGFVARPEIINSIFLGLIDLTKPNLVLAIIAAVLQFVSSKMLMPTSQQSSSSDQPAQKMAATMQKQMIFLGPVMTLIILGPLPSIIGLYWSATTIFSILQQWFTQKRVQVEAEKTENNNGGGN
ncbi:MAG TPA: YidC/Oxa1 family membrane protein insertase [Candidatus Paceibacterota bacterium]|nr:YidC/Oxa1 family membrane protein insertase [Candidatus Paceibacterota bacterium]